MTLCSGAALFAGTVALDGRRWPRRRRRRVPRLAAVSSYDWISHRSWSAELLEQTKYYQAGQDCSLDGEWQSEPTPCEADGTFALMVRLWPRQNTPFEVQGLDGSDHARTVAACKLLDHPMAYASASAAVAVGRGALANGSGGGLLNRGSPLPIGETFCTHTVETVHPGLRIMCSRFRSWQGELPGRICAAWSARWRSPTRR